MIPSFRCAPVAPFRQLAQRCAGWAQPQLPSTASQSQRLLRRWATSTSSTHTHTAQSSWARNRAFSSVVPSSGEAPAAGEESEFDNDYLDEILGALPKTWSEEEIKEKGIQYDRVPKKETPQDTQVFVRQQVPFTRRERATYGVRKDSNMKKYRKIIHESQFVMVFQHFMTSEVFNMWRAKVDSIDPAVKVHVHFKNAMFRQLLEADNDGEFITMQGLFKGPVAIVVGTDPEKTVEHIKRVMDTKADLVWTGGKVENALVTHEQLKELSTAGSEDQIRSQIIGILLGAPRQLIRVLKNPTDNIVKVLDFKANPEPEAEAAPEAEAK